MLYLIEGVQYKLSIKTWVFRIIGSCNGIMCLSGDLFGELHNLILWNPSVQKFIALPMPSIKPQVPHMFFLDLVLICLGPMTISWLYLCILRMMML